nr:sigma-70 family RNA polymerase sigma factor [Streptomyces spiramenti]
MVPLPPAFQAFHELHYPAYLSYVELQLGDLDEARRVVEDVFVYLAVNWRALMRTEVPAAEAWAVVKTVVVSHLDEGGRQPAMPETAVFRRVAAEVLRQTRGQFAVMESVIGLYPAIARLPERLFDVVVLRFVLGYPTGRVAAIMGLEEGTVRSHIHHARGKLSRDLGCGDPDERRSL